jgi:arginase
MLNPGIIMIRAPSTLGLTTMGVEELPQRLLDLGLADRIGAARVKTVPAFPPAGVIDMETGILNAPQIAAWTPVLADAVSSSITEGYFPVVLGGDCTIVLGTMLALRRKGRFGLLFVDGNADFFQPEAEPKGEGASMDLALVTGYGPSLLTNLEGRRPIVRAEDAVAFGFRDHEDQRAFGSQPLPDQLIAFDIHRVRQLGAGRAAHMAIERLTRPGLDGFFIHLDADVLDDDVMPAVDFRIPGGLSPEELREVLNIALSSKMAVGLEVTIYNPKLDGDGNAGRILTDILSDALRVDPSRTFDAN